MDVSLCPSIDVEESVIKGYEMLLGKVGSAVCFLDIYIYNISIFFIQGTLAVSAMITKVLKSLPVTPAYVYAYLVLVLILYQYIYYHAIQQVKKCGYSGLMLPVCED